MQKEMPLDRRRWSDARPDALGETRRQPVLAGKEGEEQPAQLVLIAEPEFQPDVYPARPDQRRVESFGVVGRRSEEHTSELQSLMRLSYAVFCLHTNTNT